MGATASGMQAGTAIGGSLTQATALRNSAEYNQRVAANNISLAGFEGQQVIGQGQAEAEHEIQRAKRVIGQQRSSYAGQGVDVNSGSAATVQADTKMIGQITANTIQNNAYREAFGLKAEAINIRSKADMESNAAAFEANQTLLTGGISALGSIGMAKFYNKYPSAYGANPNMKTAEMNAKADADVSVDTYDDRAAQIDD